MRKTEIIPVIHMLNINQVLANIKTCIDCGIEKVFIINHAVLVESLIDCAYAVKEKHPSLWLGLNMLGVKAKDVLKVRWGRLPSSQGEVINGLWCDETITLQDKIDGMAFKGMLFGGVAFKYQPQPVDLKHACEEAKTLTDVATTSGYATGKPANIGKIKDMRYYLGEHPLAIASGISSNNIENYKGIADYLLIASSITDTNEMIIEEKLAELKLKV